MSKGLNCCFPIVEGSVLFPNSGFNPKLSPFERSPIMLSWLQEEPPRHWSISLIAVLIVRATAGGGPTHILPLVVIRQESLFSRGHGDVSCFTAVCEVQGYGGWHEKKRLEWQKVGICVFSIVTLRKKVFSEMWLIKLSLEYTTVLFLIILDLDLEISRLIWLDIGLFSSRKFSFIRQATSLVCWQTSKDQHIQNIIITGTAADWHHLKQRSHFTD